MIVSVILISICRVPHEDTPIAIFPDIIKK